MAPPSRLVLLAEDDPDDVFLIRQAATRSQVQAEIAAVRDGVELLSWLRRSGDYADVPMPDLVLLDLRGPGPTDHDTVREIRGDPALQMIPTVILATSSSPDDVRRAYRNGASGYITKPATFAGLVDMLDGLYRYWFDVVTLPSVE